MTPIQTLLAGALIFNLAHVQAAVQKPTSYDMFNGYGTASGGSYNYWDADYGGSGNPTQDFSPLSGGLGDLTDGVVAGLNWDQVENLAGTGPYVGWRDIDPVITFHFAQPTSFASLTVHHDDADGYGNVATPDRFVVTVGTKVHTLMISDPPGGAPFASQILLPAGFVGDTLSLQIFRRDTALMLSEVTFDGQVAAVPEPQTYALLVAGLALVGAVARRRSGRAVRPATGA